MRHRTQKKNQVNSLYRRVISLHATSVIVLAMLLL